MYAQRLAPLFQQRKAIPFPVLEHSFTRFSGVQAEVAYAESLSAVEYLRDRYGMGEVLRMLQSIGSGVGSEEALRHSTGLDYSVLEQRIGEYLAATGRQLKGRAGSKVRFLLRVSPSGPALCATRPNVLQSQA